MFAFTHIGWERITFLLCSLFFSCLCSARSAPPDLKLIRAAVVKIEVASQRPDYNSPWKDYGYSRGRGSGVIIEGNRILTNAHVVSDAKYIKVKKENSGTPYPARVVFIGHDCDLAVIEVLDKDFFTETHPLPIGDTIPELNSTVSVYGFPMGGRRISVTRGIVSRIDYTLYSHSSRDSHLILQIDAAINPGNSGGPVIQDNKIVGIAFEGVRNSENIGYGIPTTVIDHFLRDIEDGHYDGYPDLGFINSNLLNRAYRDFLSLPEGESGVVVATVIKDSSSDGLVQPGDVLLTIDDNLIRNDGTILVDGASYYLDEVVERKQVGESVSLEILRDGKPRTLRISLKKELEAMRRAKVYDQKPDYFIAGGLIFEPLSRNYLETWGRDWWNRADKRLLYYFDYYTRDGIYLKQPEVIVMLRVLSAPVNRYYTGYENKVVARVNGRKIKSMEDLVRAFDEHQGDYQVIEFEDSLAPFVFNAAEMARENPEILKRYGIKEDRHISKPAGISPGKN